MCMGFPNVSQHPTAQPGTVRPGTWGLGGRLEATQCQEPLSSRPARLGDRAKHPALPSATRARHREQVSPPRREAPATCFPTKLETKPQKDGAGQAVRTQCNSPGSTQQGPSCAGCKTMGREESGQHDTPRGGWERGKHEQKTSEALDQANNVWNESLIG